MILIKRKIDKIRNDLTNDKKIENKLKEIREVKLPSEIQEFVENYNSYCGNRNEFLWRWCWILLTSKNPGFTLNSVPENKIKQLSKAKLSLILHITIIDDIADIHNKEEFLKTIIKIPFKNEYKNKKLKPKNKKLYNLIKKLYEYVNSQKVILFH